MTRVVLPIENKVRELIGKLWLALVLARDGHEIVLGPASPINLSLDVLEPDVYFALSATDTPRRRKQLQSLKRCGTKIAVLDTEGSGFPRPQEFQTRLNPEIMSMVDYYFAWGNAAVEVIEEYDRQPSGEIIVTGNPRFDLVQKDLKAVYEPDAGDINVDIGEYILFNTSYAINHVDWEKLVTWSTGHKREVARVQTRVIGEIISAIGEVATALSSRKVVIRPHPAEDLDLYRRLFMPYENVLTRREGDVRPWLLGADAVVHNSCTTGVSAALLEKPVFAYTPDDLAFHPSPVPNAVSTAVKSKSELVKRLNDCEHGERHRMREDQRNKLRYHIANVEFRSAERIRDALNDVGRTDGKSFQSEFNPPFDQRVKRRLLRYGGTALLDRYYRLLGRERYDYKVSPIEIVELNDLINRFPEHEVPDDLRVTGVPSVRDTYFLKLG